MGRRARERGRRRTWLGVVLLAVSALLVGALVAALLWVDSRTPELDASMCPVEGEPVAHVAIVLDVTEPYLPIQKAYIQQYLEELIEEAPVHSQVSLSSLDASLVDRVEPIVTLCNPGSAEEATPLYQNPDRIQARWKEGFREPIQRLLDEALASEGAPTSPIMERLQAVAVTAFPRDAAAPRTIVLVSDLLQHTSAYSHYAGRPPSLDGFLESEAAKGVRVDLRGAEVRVLYVRRPGERAQAVQGRAHVTFWEGFVRQNNGRLVEVQRVPG